MQESESFSTEHLLIRVGQKNPMWILRIRSRKNFRLNSLGVCGTFLTQNDTHSYDDRTTRYTEARAHCRRDWKQSRRGCGIGKGHDPRGGTSWSRRRQIPDYRAGGICTRVSSGAHCATAEVRAFV